MELEQKKKLYTALYLIMIVVVLATCVFLYFYLTGQGAECLADPIQYYSEKTGQMCYCNNGIGWINPN